MSTSTAKDKLLIHWATWTIIGATGIVLSHYLGFLPLWVEEWRSFFADAPFYLPSDAYSLPRTFNFILTIALILLLVFNLLHIGKRRQRTLVWLGSIILITLFTPVLSLWGVYFNAVPYIISFFIAGLGAVYSPKSWIVNDDNTDTTLDTL